MPYGQLLKIDMNSIKLLSSEATHEWNHLRLQDFKTVDEFNNVVHKI